MFAIGDREWPGISKLMEEAGEVGQVCGKLMGTRGAVQHWDGSNLRDRLVEELADLMAAIRFVMANCDLDQDAINRRVLKKFLLFEKWHQDELAKDQHVTYCATQANPAADCDSSCEELNRR